MSKLISKVGEGGKGNISFETIQDFCFFLYLMATTAHQTGEGFDAIFIRASFVLFLGFSVLQMILENYFKWNSFISWFLLFLGYGYLSTLWAADTVVVGQYTNTFIQMVGCIICLSNRIKKFEDIDKYITMIVYSLAYTVLILLIKTPSDAWGTERIGMEIGIHSNAVGFRLAMGVLLALYLAMYRKKKFFFAFVVLFVAITLYTGSRKGIIILMSGLTLYPLISSNKKIVGKEIINFIIKLILIIIALVVVIYLVSNNEIFYNIIGHRLETMFEYFSGDVNADSSIAERNFFIAKAVELFKANPILGYGMNNFKVYMNEINYHHQTFSHNNFVELLSTLGLVGFTIYYWMIVRIIIDCFKLFFKKTIDHPRNVVLIAIILIEVLTSWWNMSYINEFSMVLYVLIYLNNKISLEALKNEHN